MNSINSIITDIRKALEESFSETDGWFDKPVELRTYKPQNGRWAINEVLEHISLTNHFLLILIEKGVRKALDNIHQLDLKEELKNYTFRKDRLDEVGIYKSFVWIRPEHMEPTGTKNNDEIRLLLKSQLERCITHLDSIPDGEGILYKTTMAVNDLGKTDVYEYIYFLAMHVWRHVEQMKKIEKEYKINLNGL